MVVDKFKFSSVKLADAFDDLRSAYYLKGFCWQLARLKLKNQYRGSVLGPFWITISSSVFFIGLGVVYSQLWNMPLDQYLPWLISGFSIWICVSQIVNESTNTYISAETLLKRRPLPLSSLNLQQVFSNSLFFLHQFPLILISIPLSEAGATVTLLWLPIGLIFLAINAFLTSIVLGIICARFRDVQQIIATIMQLAFFMTPIIWNPELLGPNQHLVYLNPFTSFIELIRSPILGYNPTRLAFTIVAGITIMNALCSLYLIAKYKKRVVFWI